MNIIGKDNESPRMSEINEKKYYEHLNHNLNHKSHHKYYKAKSDIKGTNINVDNFHDINNP